MCLRVMLICLLLALSLAAPTATAATRDANTGELPLGKPGLKETRTTQEVAPGITYTRIVRGEQSKKDFYTVDVAFEADQSSADGLAAQLQSDGYEPMVQEISERAPMILRADHSATWCAPALSRRKQKPTPCETGSRRTGTRGFGSSTPAETAPRRRVPGSCTC